MHWVLYAFWHWHNVPNKHSCSLRVSHFLVVKCWSLWSVVCVRGQTQFDTLSTLFCAKNRPNPDIMNKIDALEASIYAIFNLLGFKERVTLIIYRSSLTKQVFGADSEETATEVTRGSSLWGRNRCRWCVFQSHDSYNPVDARLRLFFNGLSRYCLPKNSPVVFREVVFCEPLLHF